jgi:RND superfamily putative drug exporter
VPRFGSEGTDETHGTWRRVGERVAATPRRVWITTVLLLGLGCLGLTSFSTGLTNTQDFRGRVQSVEGHRLIAKAFPAGANAPTDVVVCDVGAVQRVQRALRSVLGVAAVGPPELGRPGARFGLTLNADPYSTTAENLVPRLRAAAHAASPTALVGGPTAQQKDFDTAAAHDNRLIVPIVLALVFVILALLLRAVTLPLLLIATVILSFGAALGVSSAVFDHLFGYPGEPSTLPLLAFIFLVALGVDYNIFLVARAREEALRHGTWHGMLRGLAVTGGHHLSGDRARRDIHDARDAATEDADRADDEGVEQDPEGDREAELAVLVPALVFDIGPRVWWPSALARKEETRYRRGEADFVPRTDERHRERPAALAASDAPDGPN